MYCKNCGKEIPEGAKFCPACGTATGAAQKQTASYTQDQGSRPQKKTRAGRRQTPQRLLPGTGGFYRSSDRSRILPLAVISYGPAAWFHLYPCF